MNNLKSLDELTVLELPLNRNINNSCTIGIKEDDLEEYLLNHNYNVYTSQPISKKYAHENNFTLDSTLLSDVMDSLGFSIEVLEDETNLFYIEDKMTSRYIEIIQEACDIKRGDYSISDSEDGDMFLKIYAYDYDDENKQYNIIYSFENDDYIVQK